MNAVVGSVRPLWLGWRHKRSIRRLAALAVALTPMAGLALPVLASPARAEYHFIGKWGSNGSGDGQFLGAAGIAIDAAKNVYVVDGGNHRIQRFTLNGVFITKWGGFGSATGQFVDPSAVATDAAGDVYVADSSNRRIQKFTSSGAFIRQWGSIGSGNGQFSDLGGVATDAAGNVYVVERSNRRVQKFSSNGVFITKWGGSGAGNGQFSFPNGVATDAAGNVYVADTENNRVQKFSSNGAFISKWGRRGSGDGQFTDPYGVATDAAGSVYVIEPSSPLASANHRIQKFSSNGAFITKWGSPGSGDGQFGIAPGVATYAGFVYVADGSNSRVQVFAPGPPAPVAGRSVDAAEVSGKVYTKCKGDKKRKRLSEAKSLRVGCVVYALKGKVRITAAANRDSTKTKSAVFYQGDFKIKEKRSSKPVTELALVGKLDGLLPQGQGTAQRQRVEAQAPPRKAPVGQGQGPLPHPRPAQLGRGQGHDLARRGPLRRLDADQGQVRQGDRKGLRQAQDDHRQEGPLLRGQEAQEAPVTGAVQLRRRRRRTAATAARKTARKPPCTSSPGRERHVEEVRAEAVDVCELRVRRHPPVHARSRYRSRRATTGRRSPARVRVRDRPCVRESRSCPRTGAGG